MICRIGPSCWSYRGRRSKTLSAGLELSVGSLVSASRSCTLQRSVRHFLVSLSHTCFHAVNLNSAKGKFRFSSFSFCVYLSKRRKPSGNSSHLWRTYCVQGTVTQFTHSNSFNPSKQSCEVNTIIIPFYILGKCSIEEVT